MSMFLNAHATISLTLPFAGNETGISVEKETPGPTSDVSCNLVRNLMETGWATWVGCEISKERTQIPIVAHVLVGVSE